MTAFLRHCEEPHFLRHCEEPHFLRHCEERSDVAVYGVYPYQLTRKPL